MFGNNDEEDEGDEDDDDKITSGYDNEGIEILEDDEQKGIKIVPLNMDDDMEDGHFDESGAFIQKKDEHQIHDNWLQGVTTEEIKKARRAHEAANKAKEESEKNASRYRNLNANQLLKKALSWMKPGETTLSTIQRLGAGSNKKKSQKSKKSNEMESQLSPQILERMKLGMNIITELCDNMMGLGHLDIYEMRYEQIVRKLRVAESLADHWMPEDPIEGEDGGLIEEIDQYEYKWGKDEVQVFGPFTKEMMCSWSKQGCFSQGDLWVRKLSQLAFQPVSNFGNEFE